MKRLRLTQGTKLLVLFGDPTSPDSTDQMVEAHHKEMNVCQGGQRGADTPGVGGM